jgi:DNA-binding response OmpR family regulator
MRLVKDEVDAATRDFKVLVADDSRVYRKLVGHSLSDKRYALLFAKNGNEAIALFSEHQPSIVITDWMMPDLSGIELCEHIRKQSRQPYTYLIILTGNTEKDKLVTGLAAGADDYLTKPFHREELLARVGVGRRIVEPFVGRTRTHRSSNRTTQPSSDRRLGHPATERSAEVWLFVFGSPGRLGPFQGRQ